MIIRVTLFKPESSFARQIAPKPGVACLQTVITLSDGRSTHDNHWLQPDELHCPFDPKWLSEHIEVLWKRLGQALMPDEITVVERTSPRRCELERHLRGLGQEGEEV